MQRAMATALCLLAIIIMATPVQAALKGPRIVFDKLELNFPEIKEGQPVKAVFDFTNKGDQNLILDRVEPSCGCTTSNFSKIVEPGKRGKVVLDLDTVGITGAFRKTAAVATNDPTKPVVTLVMMGETMGRVKVSTGRRIELDGCLGTTIATTVTVSDPANKPLLISSVDNPMSQYLDVKLKPVPGGKAYKLILTSKATEPLDYAGPLFLSIPGSSRVSIWVVAHVRGAFKVQPQEVIFGTLIKGSTGVRPRSVLVKKDCAPNLKIDGINYNKELFEVQEHWQKPGEELLLVITPKVENLMVGPFEHKLQINTGGRAYTVHLSGQVR